MEKGAVVASWLCAFTDLSIVNDSAFTTYLDVLFEFKQYLIKFTLQSINIFSNFKMGNCLKGVEENKIAAKDVQFLTKLILLNLDITI